MDVPRPVRDQVEAALARIGRESTIRRASTVPGGCVNHGTRIRTDEDSYFLKWNPRAPDGLFAAERDGLDALRAARAAGDECRLEIPQTVARSEDGERPAWLLLEWIEPAPSLPRHHSRPAERLGRGLARIHASPRGDADFGWRRDNWIGALPQSNTPTANWAEFWRDRRIVPQLDMARAAGLLGHRVMDRLVDAIGDALAGVTAPELVHGDLWNGNTLVTRGGVPVLVDPAVHRGDGELDIAMSQLFGGFGDSFYDAYAELRPLSDAYRSHRRDLYQLYFLLVHVNLFGASYEAGAVAAASRVVSALA